MSAIDSTFEKMRITCSIGRIGPACVNCASRSG